MQKLSLATSLVLATTALTAQSPLTTQYVGAALLSGPTVYFNDLVVNVPLTITQVDVNTSSPLSTPGTLDFYWLVGSRVGNETNVAAWTFAGSANVVAGGTNLPTVAVLTAPITFAPGNYSLAIQTNGINSYYSNNTNLSYSTTELTLLNGGGSSNGALGTAICCEPRTWNGSIHYTLGGGGGTVATNTSYGQGCVAQYASFYETFPNGTFDLSNTSLSLFNTGNGYVALPAGTGWFTPLSAPIALIDDSVSAAQNLGFTLNYPGGSTQNVYISSNGFVWAQASTVNGCCAGTPATLLTQGPRWCPIWGDLNPALGGSVHFDTDPANGAAYVTFVNVPEFNAAANTNTFQVAFFSTGAVEYRYQGCMQANRVVLTGWSPGAANVDPGSRDLSTSLPLTASSPDILPVALQSSARPIINTSVNLVTSRITPTAPFGAVLLSLVQTNIDLTPIGMAGCSQFTGGDATLLFVPLGQPTASVPLQIPNFVGYSIFAQAVVYDPAAGLTALGAMSSNGVQMAIGNL